MGNKTTTIKQRPTSNQVKKGNRSMPMTPKAGVTLTRRRYGEGGKASK